MRIFPKKSISFSICFCEFSSKNYTKSVSILFLLFMSFSRCFLGILLSLIVYSMSIAFTFAEGISPYRSVVKIRSYTHDVFTDTYSSYSEGSAVIV